MKRILFLLFAALALNLTMVAQESTKITEWEDTAESTTDESSDNQHSSDWFDFDGGSFMGPTVAIVAITFAFPIVIVFIAFYFQYRNRKARYRLIEQAIAAGQPIPEEFLKAKNENNTLSKGIQNIFVGLGLFIFLWAITTSFAIGTIGLLIMFSGFAQVIIYYANKDR
ncbi:DUF6249 domain-containing protein [Bacteroides sp. 519]|uniref:DUF6249 domain-containing protein n=1 Tax=Bacteroides sp. 519 TaxID=2302937 RepID=UPI0013D677AA|nr:DUF6249 domain-containing protein [Bacteroides sp. 519]NDV58701.1 hypothetical protein [Bacteroides sp. 519]